MDPMYSQKLVFEGISVDVNGDGSQHHLDATVGRSKASRMDWENSVLIARSRQLSSRPRTGPSTISCC